MEQPITEPRLKAIETRQDKLESEIIEHIEHQTQGMHTSFQTMNARLDQIESTMATKEDLAIMATKEDIKLIRETLTDYRVIAQSHGDLLHQIVQLLQKKSGEE